MSTYVLVHVKHIFDKTLGHPVDKFRWLSAHESFEDASIAAQNFVKVNDLAGEIPLYAWWAMDPDPQRWYLSNEFGPKKDVGNSLRVLLR